jgi:putative transposase
MPRASEYLLEGYTYHLTHRCHNRQFFLRLARDRELYREWMFEGIRRFHVPLYGYCITANHVHLVVHADNIESVSQFMHLAAGSTAKHYNLRKEHLGSIWEHPYQCTIIENQQHLFNCLCYVDLNMVRAGVVSHPRDWRWCGFDELSGRRKRYRLLNMDRLLESLNSSGIREFQEHYSDSINHRLSTRQLVREAHWTESLAVGSKTFIEQLQPRYPRRQRFKTEALLEAPTPTWTVKESPAPYSAI